MSFYKALKGKPVAVQKQAFLANKNKTTAYAKTVRRGAGKPPKTKKAKLAKQVANIQKKLNTAMGCQTSKYIGAATLRCASNQCVYTNNLSFGVTEIESAMSSLKYFNPSDPGNLVSTNFTTGSFQKEVLVQGYGSLQIRNNYQVPCVLDLYVCKVKQDTSTSPLSYVTDGLTDNGFSTPSTNILGYPTDSDTFLDNWKVIQHQKKTLMAGDMTSISYSTKKFSYDPSYVDTHALTYQVQYDSHIILYRLQGIVGHDNTSAVQQGTLAAGIDILLKQNVKVEYNAGADINYYVLSNQLTSMTTQPVISTYDVESINYTTA
nr:MAG: putative capsid protein [Arizlama virus]